MKRGQIPVAILTQIFGFMAAIIAPVLYVGSIKENVAVQENRINTVEKKIEKIDENTEYIRRWVEMSNNKENQSRIQLTATSTRQ